MNEQQKERYNRHIILNEIGEDGQQKLLDAKVLVVGAGGLGAPVLQYLCAAGVGTIGIVDADVVSISNLQRQILYSEEEIGKSKVQQSKERLNQLNSDVQINTYPIWLTDENAESIIEKYDIVVGATDNFLSRKYIDKVTKKEQKAFVHASIGEFQGQVSVFNYKNGPSYFDLFPDVPDQKQMPLGVLGVLPGIIGSMQACEVLKIILGIGEVLSGKLLVYDALSNSMNILEMG
ncbi:HesA/MoeB/ThiF family protein [Prolixibacteraceae bacterium JC049]|nr:HesA/MoeB/ThiF family protein [Prolixibacteraceae bacterium JC049]